MEEEQNTKKSHWIAKHFHLDSMIMSNDNEMRLTTRLSVWVWIYIFRFLTRSETTKSSWTRTRRRCHRICNIAWDFIFVERISRNESALIKSLCFVKSKFAWCLLHFWWFVGLSLYLPRAAAAAAVEDLCHWTRYQEQCSSCLEICI